MDAPLFYCSWAFLFIACLWKRLTCFVLFYDHIEGYLPKLFPSFPAKETVCFTVGVCVWLFPGLRRFWRMFDSSFLACPFTFFFKVEIRSSALISLFRPRTVHSGSASWGYCGRVFPDKLCVSLFPCRFPILCLHSGMVSPPHLRWVKGVCMFRGNLPPALLAEWPGSFTCHCSNMRVERTLNKSQLTKFTLEKMFLLLLLRGFRLTTFQS